VAAIKRAFLTAKTSQRDWSSYKREGRFDQRAGARAVRGEIDVFRRKTGRSTTHVNVSVLLDMSGSMQNEAKIEHPDRPSRKVKVSRFAAAALFGATIAKALGSIPTVHLDVWEHSTSNRLNIKWRWHKGTPVGVFNETANGGSVPNGGNADGHAVYAMIEKMRRESKRDERNVILVVSDGLPSDSYAAGSQPGQALRDAIAHGKRHGIPVLGVAIDGSDQRTYYGDGYIPFDGSWTHLGASLAKVVGKALATPPPARR